MSGPKCARVRPNPRLMLERLRDEGVRRVRDWRAIASPETVVAHLAGLAALEEAFRTQVPGGAGGARLLESFAARRAELEVELARLRPAFEAFHEALAGYQAATAAVESALAGGPPAESLASRLQTALGAAAESVSTRVQGAEDYTRALAAGTQALTALIAAIRGGALKPGSGASLEQTFADLLRETALANQLRELDCVRTAPLDDWADGWDGLRPWLRDQSRLLEFRGACARVQAAIDQADPDLVQRELRQARSQREALLLEAQTHRIQAADMEKVAIAWERALCGLHYDRPIVNFRPGKVRQDPLAPLKLRADVPRGADGDEGRGNIRVEFALGGKVDLAIENVPQGEEALCRTLIGALGQAAQDAGLDFAMTDWGRARGGPAPDADGGGLVVGKERQRERPKQRE